jgi:hypothetical protein
MYIKDRETLIIEQNSIRLEMAIISYEIIEEIKGNYDKEILHKLQDEYFKLKIRKQEILDMLFSTS